MQAADANVDDPSMTNKACYDIRAAAAELPELLTVCMSGSLCLL